MRSADFVRLSCGYALRRRWRAVPSLVGVAIGVAGLVVVLTAAETIHTTSGRDVLGQQGLRQVTVSSVAPPGPKAITNAAMRRFGTLPHVVAVYPIAEVDVVGTAGGVGYVVPIGNLPPSERPVLVAGRWPTGDEITLPDSGLRNKTGEVISASRLLRETLAVHVRSLQGLGPETTVPLTIVGAYRHVGSSGASAVAYAPLATVNHLLALSVGETDEQYLLAATYPECVVVVDAPGHVSQVGRVIDSQGFVTNYVDKQVAGLTTHLQGVQLTAAMAALVVILLCILSVTNQVASSVRHRRAELGIMLAIGFGHRALASVIAGEAVRTPE